MLELTSKPGHPAVEAPIFFYAAIGAAMDGNSALAIELVERCVWFLSELVPEMGERMARQGIDTIDELETLHGLDNSNCMRTLRLRLQAAAS